MTEPARTVTDSGVTPARSRAATRTRPTRRMGATPSWLTLALLLALAIAIRLPWLPMPGFTPDITVFTNWSVQAFEHGVPSIYTLPSAGTPQGMGSLVDVPPVYMYLRVASVAVFHLLYGGVPVPSDPRWLTLLKLPTALADVVVVALIYLVVVRRRGRAWALLSAGFYALDPAIWYDSAWWGQSDGVFLLALVVMLYLVPEGDAGPDPARSARQGARLTRFVWVGISAALSLLVKAQAVVALPALAVGLWRAGRFRALAAAAVAGAVAGALILTPLALSGHLGNMLQSVYILSGNEYHYVDVGAINLWMASTLPPMTRDDLPMWGPVTPKMVGLALLAVWWLVALAALAVRSYSRERLLLAGASLAAGFYLVSTEMHERYILPAVALLLAAGIGTWRRALVAILLSTGGFLGLLLATGHHGLTPFPVPPITPIPLLLGVLLNLTGGILLVMETMRKAEG